MRALHRKLIRELAQLRWQALAICLVLASGVATFVMSLTTLDSLVATRAEYYARANFGQVFASLKRAPRALESRLREIPGIADVETRVVVPALLDVAGLSEPATACLVSIPDFTGPQVNRLHVRVGRLPSGATRGEALVSEAFATAQGLKPGDQVRAIIHGRFQVLKITGIALSPEYIYSVRGGELLPDDKRFGVFWLAYSDLAAAYDMDGAFNDVSATLLANAREPEVLDCIDRLLEPYGGGGAFGRDHQPSYRFLENELIQLRGMAVLPPAIFLAVTTFLLQIVLSRLVATQREQIATLRAFGYTQLEVQRHYLAFALLLIVMGSCLGVIAGCWLGQDLTNLYAKFFRFPEFHYRVRPSIPLGGVGVSAALGLLATWQTVRRAARERPAVAMQPAGPPRFRPSLLDRWGWGRRVPPATRMVWRHLEQRPRRALATSLGVAFAVAILVLGSFAEDTVNFVMDFQFQKSNRQDITVTFVEPSSGRASHALRRWPGVLEVEPFRAAPIHLRFAHVSRRLTLLGISPDTRLFRVLDAQAQPVHPPPQGVVISEKLAEILGCEPGDAVQLEVLEGARPIRDVPVVGIVRDFVDLNAYMHIDALRAMLREEETASGAFLSVDSRTIDDVYQRLKQAPRIASVSLRSALLESYTRTMGENLLRMRAINLFFAAVVAVGVVYNAARVTLSEETRELATLRVLGFTRQETSFILLAELAILVAIAIPWGLLFGYAFAWLLAWSLATEVHRFPVIVSGSTLAMAVVVTAIAAFGSALIVRRRIDHLDLVSVLKARD
jgi:putative ABC transport system permease protein